MMNDVKLTGSPDRKIKYVPRVTARMALRFFFFFLEEIHNW